jgi:hypothetical protein
MIPLMAEPSTLRSGTCGNFGKVVPTGPEATTNPFKDDKR